MSKDKRRITRKRFVKLMAGTKGLQVQEVNPVKRKQEQRNREKHQCGAGRKD